MQNFQKKEMMNLMKRKEAAVRVPLVLASKAKPTTPNKSKTPVLDNFGRDITKLAEMDSLDPIVGRDAEIERVSQILSRRKKNNPILIGEPGVGKTAIVEGLALANCAKKSKPSFI